MEIKKEKLKDIVRFRAIDTVSGSVIGTVDVISVKSGVVMIAPEEYDSPRWDDVPVSVKEALLEPALKVVQGIYRGDLQGSYNPSEDYEYLL